jgi:hypothetical protein
MRNSLRYTASALAGLVFLTVAGCGGGQPINAESRGNYQKPYGTPMPQQQREGMSTRNKVLLLAGAAAVYYLYNKHKNREGQGPQGRYYRSKNGRVYYRDLKTGQFQWVDPPRQPIQVPAEEYERYTGQRTDNYGGGVLREAPPEWNDNSYR